MRKYNYHLQYNMGNGGGLCIQLAADVGLRPTRNKLKGLLEWVFENILRMFL